MLKVAGLLAPDYAAQTSQAVDASTRSDQRIECRTRISLSPNAILSWRSTRV